MESYCARNGARRRWKSTCSVFTVPQLKPLFEVHRALEAGSLVDPSWDRTLLQKTLPEIKAAGLTDLPTLPGYEVLRELGREQRGRSAYSAWQTGLNRVVAVKMVRAGNYIDSRRRAASTSRPRPSSLQHPNIVQIYEVGEHGGLPYLCSEFVDGGTLAEKARGKPLPPGAGAN